MDPNRYNFTHYYIEGRIFQQNGVTMSTTMRNNLISNFRINKIEFLCIVAVDTIYLIILIKTLIRYFKTRDWHFMFLIVATLFAFANNLNDIYYRILAPKLGTETCNGTFERMFKITGTLNWVPISYFQVCRLYRISVHYYKVFWQKFIIILSLLFSLIYSICYFLNLREFKGVPSKFGGCVVNNDSQFNDWIQISDVIDTTVSWLIVILTLYISIRNLKNYKSRHYKIKSILDDNVVIFTVLILSKLGLYSVIKKKAKDPGGDIWWDSLSIIVLWCTYILLNLKPRLNAKLEKNQVINNRRNRNYLKELSNLNRINNNRYNYYDRNMIFRNNTDSDQKKPQPLYNRNSKGELNFPSLMNNKKDLFNLDENNPYVIAANEHNFSFNNNKYNEGSSSSDHKKKKFRGLKSFRSFNLADNYQEIDNNYSNISNKSNPSNINMNYHAMGMDQARKFSTNDGSSSYINMNSMNSGMYKY